MRNGSLKLNTLKYLSILSFCSILFISCSLDTIDHSFTNSLQKNKKIGLMTFRSDHLGNTSAVGFGGMVGHSIALAAADKEYLHRLDVECQKMLEEVFNDSSLFTFAREQMRDAPELLDIEDVINSNPGMHEDEINEKKEEIEEINSKLVRKFLTSNGLDGAMQIRVSYTVVGLKQKLGLITDWTIYNSEGKKKVEVRTKNAIEKGSFHVNTLDPIHEKTFINLAKKSAEELISIINSKK